MNEILSDLGAEHQDLDALVAGLSPSQWDLQTPAEPWTIRDTIGHLAFFDQKQTLAITHPEEFVADINEHLAAGTEAYMAQHLSRGRAVNLEEMLAWWRGARTEMLDALSGLHPDDRILWFGPPMKARSAASARLMETWAHGQDVADVLGVERRPTDRLFAIAELGVKTYGWSFSVRGLETPTERVRFALNGPMGTSRIWNQDSTQSITGPVEDFCLVAAQRRHVDDTRLALDGPLTRRWMEIAQIFAGPPGPGRRATHR
jgi:uncharacterized protein (TIGR03084 family)